MSDFLLSFHTLSDTAASSLTWRLSMTDGPFKPRKLSRCWSQVCHAVQNDAASLSDCRTYVSEALARQVATSDHINALAEVRAYFRRPQLDFDPLRSLEEILDRYNPTPFLDNFRKYFIFHASSEPSLEESFSVAIEASLRLELREARNALHEERIAAQERGEIRRHNSLKIASKIDISFDAGDTSLARAALLSGTRCLIPDNQNNHSHVDEGITPL